MLKKISLPVQLIAIIASVLLFGRFVPEDVVRFFYTFSLLFKEVLGMLLPVIIFSFVLNGILSFKKNAPVVLFSLIALVFMSNAFVALLTYLFASVALPMVTCSVATGAFEVPDALSPFVSVSLPSLIGSEKALLAAIGIGLIFSFIQTPVVADGIRRVKELIEAFLRYIFIPLLPLYVLGFLLEINNRGVFIKLFEYYGGAFMLIVLMQLCFLLGYYFIASGFSITRAWGAIKNALPSYLTAFSTMSSTATVPVTIDCAQKNTGNRPLAEMSMPIMANVHLLGDAISTPLLALVSTSLFLGCMPDLYHYMSFVVYFCTAMFAVSAIPGGGIIVMIPVLKSQLGFTSEMVSIIMALYLLLDSFGTAANVMGDGALVMILNKVLKKLRIIA